MTNNKYIGHPLQLSGVEEYRLIGGRGDGMRLLRVRNGLGIDMTLCADRCLDISDLFFDGCRMNYTSVCGYVGPSYYQEGRDGFGFLKSFHCGLLTTCGLQTIGNPSEDEGKCYGLHGTIGNIPAEHVYYETSDEEIRIHATVRDHIIFGAKLTLERLVTVSLTDNVIAIHDTVVNEGSEKEALALLYHINVGYPLLSETAKLTVNSSQVLPRDDWAEKDIDTWDRILKPVPNFREQCYYHKIAEPTGKASITNESIGKGLELSFDTSQFPEFLQWKMMGERDYVMGIEPCTNTLEGRKYLRENDRLSYLSPGQTREFGASLRLFRTE